MCRGVSVAESILGDAGLRLFADWLFGIDMWLFCDRFLRMGDIATESEQARRTVFLSYSMSAPKNSNV